MKPHEQRVVDEKKELDERLSKLSSFISSSPVFAGLSPTDRNLMFDQRDAMTDYSEALGKRIARFSN